ncbi:uncharacterized protein TNCV_3164631 [Trichonephila clavipes]|nr:uncharacterized protein TNCV_3164631 [Trichonephila clavipes]
MVNEYPKPGMRSIFVLKPIPLVHEYLPRVDSIPVNIFGNEQEDLLAKEGCNASPPISSTLTYSEHQSRVKSEILKEWRTPPNHHWYECNHPGSLFLLKCDRASQTAISRLKSGHIKSLSFCGGRETFDLCTKCKESARLYRSHLGLFGTFPSPPGIRFLKSQWSFELCLTQSDRLRISHKNNRFLHITPNTTTKSHDNYNYVPPTTQFKYSSSHDKGNPGFPATNSMDNTGLSLSCDQQEFKLLAH